MAQSSRAPEGSHGSELVHRARTSALIISVTALLVVPAWSFFDLALEPDHARAFITVRRSSTTAAGSL